MPLFAPGFDSWVAKRKKANGGVSMKAAWIAATERAAKIITEFIPDPHKEHELCSDCAMIRSILDAIRAGV